MKWRGPLIVMGAAAFLALCTLSRAEDPAPFVFRVLSAYQPPAPTMLRADLVQEALDDLVEYAVREPYAVQLALEWWLRAEWQRVTDDSQQVAFRARDEALFDKVVIARHLLQDVLDAGR